MNVTLCVNYTSIKQTAPLKKHHANQVLTHTGEFNHMLKTYFLYLKDFFNEEIEEIIA